MRLPLLLLLALATIAPAAAAKAPDDPPDAKIVTRFTASRNASDTTTLYIKGDRSRIERELLGHPRVTINQCDQRQVFQLDPEARQFTSYRLNENGRTATTRPVVAARQQEPSGGTLVVNIETTDTGERKKLFGYSARHIIETQTMVPGPGAVSQGREIVRDGWYIDLDVNAGCGPRQNPGTFAFLNGQVIPAGQEPKIDKVEVHRKGEPAAGFAVSLRTKTTAPRPNGEPFVSENVNEVVELSSAPLDPALFELPAGYQKVDRLPDYVAAAATPRALPSLWAALKSYWSALFR